MLSVVIPAYNEAHNIARTLKELEQALEKIDRPHEVILVSDGSTDQTARVAHELKLKHLRVIEYAKNRGKGYALTVGTNESKGAMVTFFDAGGDFDAIQIDKFIKLMEVFDADVVIGSKRHPASRVNYPIGRHIGSRIYQLIIRVLFNLNIRDTQTGLKLFRRDVLLKILPRALVKRYAFDLELLVIAKHLGYQRFFEAPVDMEYNAFNSSLTKRAIFKALQDTVAIWYRLRIRHYYDKPHVRVTTSR